MKIVGIGGAPACGKSTLMRSIMKHSEETDWREEKHGTLVYQQGRKTGLIVLGQYSGDAFDGTDRLSMAVQPDFAEFLKSVPNNSTILFEGDRLFNAITITTIKTLGIQVQLKMILLTVERSVQQARWDAREARGLQQSSKFIKGRITKCQNLLFMYPQLFEIYPNNSLVDMNDMELDIFNFINTPE